jgi:hypothetical protein
VQATTADHAGFDSADEDDDDDNRDAFDLFLAPGTGKDDKAKDLFDTAKAQEGLGLDKDSFQFIKCGEADVTCVALHHDGRRAYAGDADGNIWETELGSDKKATLVIAGAGSSNGSKKRKGQKINPRGHAGAVSIIISFIINIS